MHHAPEIVVIGAGFTGLAASWELVQQGFRPLLLEADYQVGGLAGSFQTSGDTLEKFYHHWFTSDADAFALAADVGAADRIVYRPTQTGTWYANSAFRLATPWDLVRFPHLGLADRLRLGRLALRARRTDPASVEHTTASDWLISQAGPEVYRVIWEPLLSAKFGPYAQQISAAWMAAKLRLRGGSRSANGTEQLAYFEGGFGDFAQRVARQIERGGGTISMGEAATMIEVVDGRVSAVHTARRRISAQAVLATTALPITADLLEQDAPMLASACRQIDYLANVCLVLELDRSLSDTYWLNVCDPSFPFVAVIEHTNFRPSASYGGSHFVYLSRYLTPDQEDYAGNETSLVRRWLQHLKRMFPGFKESWVRQHHVWRARFAQPVVTTDYRAKLPHHAGDVDALFLASMAQIYPEDRGTNYAIRDGRAVARLLAESLIPVSE